jgi:hypothetical protein
MAELRGYDAILKMAEKFLSLPVEAQAKNVESLERLTAILRSYNDLCADRANFEAFKIEMINPKP